MNTNYASTVHHKILTFQHSSLVFTLNSLISKSFQLLESISLREMESQVRLERGGMSLRGGFELVAVGIDGMWCERCFEWRVQYSPGAKT